MDLSAPIIYNSLTFAPPAASPGRPRGGYEINDIDFSEVGVTAYLDKRALQDGLDASDVYLDGRNVQISGSVLGTTAAHTWDNLQALMAAFSPTEAYRADTDEKGFLPFKFRQPTIDTATWTAGYIPLQFYLRPSSPVRYRVTRPGVAGTKGFAIPFRVSMVARDPRKYAQTEQLIGVSSSTDGYATHRGDYPTMPVISMTLTAAGSSAFTVFVDGTSARIDLSGRSSGTLLLDYANRTLTDSVTDVQYMSLLTGNFVPIRPPGVQVYFVNSTGLSSVVAHYREAWA